MSCDFVELANPGIRDLKPYQPGKPIEELRRELGIDDIIKLASNENPLGASPKGIEAALNVVPDVAIYPDGSGYQLKNVLADKFKIDAEKITLGNGSDSLLAMFVQAFVKPGDEVITSQYAFAPFSILTKTNHGTPVIVPAKQWSYDLPAMLAAINDKTRIIFIANPNNPTGTWLTETQLTNFLKQVPDNVIVVFDEAYYEYIDHPDYPNSIALQENYPNLIITRTFSKIYGLAGLRIGYSITTTQIASVLNRIRLPFNVSVPALVAAAAALQDDEHVKKSLRVNQLGMQQLSEGFERLKLEYIPSVCNFLTVDVGRDGQQVYQELLKHGIIVRPLVPYGMPNHLRISIGSEHENSRLIDALTEILK